MSGPLHGFEANDEGLFIPPNAPDFVAVWQCSKCGFRINSALEASAPNPAKKLFRRRSGGPEEWYNCEEVIALNIMES